jgi:demethylmenaquinone methyltransferase / 2-methoxy-6-polyprenyl-1,4-benzoquinol methylase
MSVLPHGAEKEAAVEAMFDRVAPRYDRMNRVISFGLDRGWRRSAVRALAVSPGARVLDVACGTGDLCDELFKVAAEPVGVDLSAGMLAVAHTRAPLARADALQLPVSDASVDGVISGFALRNVVDLAAFFVESARVLRPGGRIAALETSEPDNPAMRAVHRFWSRRVVPALGARFSSDPAAYRYLPESAAYMPSPGALLDLIRGCGFERVERRALSGGAVQLITGTRR